MATPRLPFLWPMLYRAGERVALEAPPAVRRRALHATARRRQNAVQQRYGSANEPPPHLDVKQVQQAAQTDPNKAAAAVKSQVEAPTKDIAKSSKDDQQAIQKSAGRLGGDPMLDSAEDAVSESIPGLKTASEKPKESLLDQVPDPATPNAPNKDASDKSTATSLITYEEHSPPIHAPHMEPPRYVHHFDTFGLVKRLEESGWKSDQSITLMKSVRLMLGDNMNLAREALVSKSQVENETYLFKAACSELRTEVSTRRKTEQDKMRTERTHLQHELDILNQKFGQDMGGLKDDLKGMFDDRKMLARNEQRDMERKIQELNYKITVSLQADSKSDVEALRWIMTRRVIITLGLIVVMVLSSLKLYSNALHDREMEQKRRAKMRNASTQVDSGTSPLPDAGLVAGEMLVKDGDNPAYVSLG